MDFKFGHVLVVDRDKAFGESVRRHLRREGYEVATVSDVVEAGQYIQRQLNTGKWVDLVIADLFLPMMYGLDLLDWIKRYHPYVSVVLMTTDTGGGIESEYIRPQMDGLCRKPFEPKELRACISGIEVIHNKKGAEWNQPKMAVYQP
jgi:DNA-binding response OmpR family regulator